jgi:hypothetical protein
MHFRHHPATVLTAFAAGSVAAGLVGGVVMQLKGAMAVGIVVAGLHALFLGLPAYALLAPKMPATLPRTLIAGFVVGGVPTLLLSMLVLPTSASIGDVATVRNGAPTGAGVLINLAFAGAAGLLGAIGGLAFWAALRIMGGASSAIRNPAPDSGPTPSPGLRPVRTTLVLVGLVAVAGATMFLAAEPIDRSCHNVFRGGGRSIPSQRNATLDLGPADWPEIKRTVQAFADERGWSYRVTEAGDPSSYAAMDLSICAEAGTVISVGQHYQPGPPAGSERAAHPMPRDVFVMRVDVYQPQGGDSWREPSEAFLDRLQARWGDRMEYQDGQGRALPRAPASAQAGDR